jgi:plasmid stabilization system protein ParE
MRYRVIIEPEAQSDLQSIFNYISENDSDTKARNFLEKLQDSINTLSYMPQRCRDSHYLDDGRTKDLIYKGYTICYCIVEESVHVVTVFRQR